MVLIISFSTRYRIPVVFSLIFFISLLFSCSQREYQHLFVPDKSYSKLDYKLQPIPISLELLGGAVTKLLIDNQEYTISIPFTPIKVKNIPSHPVAGPFFFTNGKIDVIVGKDDSGIDKWAESISNNSTRDLVFVKLLEWQGENKLSLSKAVRYIQNKSLNNQISINSKDGKFKLTPWNMAESLSQFSNWEGIHLDTVRGELTFIGSNRQEIPQISASDLIAAYNSIFVHESAGEALFVDMDFAGNDRDYLVTFGGGFEDTRPGRVLFIADLLLKAISSGIDPWDQASPLVKDWCNSNNSNQFQKIFCNHVRDFALSPSASINTIKKVKSTILENGKSAARVIAGANVTGSQSCISYIMSAQTSRKEKVISDILKDGKYETNSGSCYFEYDDSGERLLEWVQGIFSLSNYEKSIVRSSKKFSEDHQRILYALLALGSRDAKAFLDNQSLRKIITTFELLDEIAPGLNLILSSLGDINPYDPNPDFSIISEALEYESIQTVFSFVYFMTEKPDFARSFFSLNRLDQLTLAYITIGALRSKGFAAMLNDLQYYHPLCRSNRIPTEIKNVQDAFIRFTCTHLSSSNQIYLADLIREETRDSFPFFTAEEFGIDFEEEQDFKSTRYWFYPANEVVHLSEDLNTFLFNRPNMEARAERLDTRRGPYEAIEYYEKERIPGIHDNLDLINKHYGAFSEVFPTLKELNNLVKMLAFFRWIYYYHPEKFDLEAFNNAVDYGTPTERIYPIHETVIALPTGGWLISKGGVDLHSKTQVKIDQPKINRLLRSISKKNLNGSFEMDNQTYQVAQPIRKTYLNEFDSKKTLKTDELKIQIQRKDGLPQLAVTNNSELSYSLNSTVDVFGDEYSIQYDYQNNNRFKEAWSIKKGLSESWIIENYTDSIIFQRTEREELNTNNSYIKIIEKKFSELIQLGLPFEELWNLMSEDFENVKLTKRNGNYLYTFIYNRVEYNLLGKMNGMDKFSVRFCTSEERDSIIEKKVLKENGLIELRLQSIVPTDSLIVSELGIKNDNLIRVEVYSESIDTFEYSDWTLSLASERELNFNSREFNVLAPIQFEKVKGQYQSYELTNRPFLIESVTSLRKKYHSKSKKVVLCRDLIDKKIIGNESPKVWIKPTQRLFVIDPKGFSKHYLKKLDLIAKNDKAIILGVDTLSDNEKDIDEVIWISTLSEREIANRLEENSSKGLIKKAKRIRILNVNNPVYDLGTNLFVEHPNLKVIGAYPLILDFETMYPVLKDLLDKNSETKMMEFDQQVAATIKRIKRKYRNNPTPLKLRINRYLDDLNSSWEEVNPYIYSRTKVRWTKL